MNALAELSSLDLPRAAITPADRAPSRRTKRATPIDESDRPVISAKQAWRHTAIRQDGTGHDPMRSHSVRRFLFFPYLSLNGIHT